MKLDRVVSETKQLVHKLLQSQPSDYLPEFLH